MDLEIIAKGNATFYVINNSDIFVYCVRLYRYIKNKVIPNSIEPSGQVLSLSVRFSLCKVFLFNYIYLHSLFWTKPTLELDKVFKKKRVNPNHEEICPLNKKSSKLES